MVILYIILTFEHNPHNQLLSTKQTFTSNKNVQLNNKRFCWMFQPGYYK